MSPPPASQWPAIARALWGKYMRDETMDAAGALTFYAFLAAFPFLLFIVTFATRQLTPELTSGLVTELGRVAPKPVTALVADRLRALQQGAGVGLLTLTLAGAIWSSVTAVVALMAALNRAYEVRETRSFWQVHGLALVTMFLLGATVVGAAALTVAWPLVANAIGGAAGATMAWLRFPVAGLLVMSALGVSYRWLPDVRPRRQCVVPGAIVGVLLWLLTSWGFSTFVRLLGTYEVVYGALGGVAVLLLWMWLTGQAILVGAELNLLLARPRGPDARTTSLHP